MFNKLQTVCAALSFILMLTFPVAAEGAKDRLVAGGQSLAQGRPFAARAELQSALERFRKVEDRRGEAMTLILLATTEVNLGNPDVARGHLQTSSRIFRERKDVLGTWFSLFALAQMERAIGHYTAALASQDEAQRVIERAEEAEEDLSLPTFNLMLYAFGLPAIDLTGAPTGMDEFLKAVLLGGVLKLFTHDAYAGILIEVGQYDRAEKELQAAIAVGGPYANDYRYSIAAHLGELRYRQRRFPEARVQFEKALQGSLRMPFNPLGEQWITVGIRSRLAELDAAENRIDDALAWNGLSLDAVRGAHNQLKESEILEERGLLLLQGDRLPEAETALEQAREIAITIQSEKQQSSIESRLADVTFLAGNYGTAVAHLEEAIRLDQILHSQATEGLLWANLAVLYVLTSNEDAADTLLTHARALAATSEIDLVCDVVSFLETVQKFRNDTADAGDLRSALQRLTANPQFKAIDIRGDAEHALRDSLPLGDVVSTLDSQTSPRMSIYAVLAYSNEARRALQSGNASAARRLFEKVLSLNPTGELRARTQAAIGACFWREGNAEQAVLWFSAAAKTLDTVVDDLRAESMLISFLGSADHRAYYDVLVEALLREHYEEKAFEVTERARARGFLRAGSHREPAAGTGTVLALKAAEVRGRIEQWSTLQRPGETLDDLRLQYEVLQSRVQSARDDASKAVIAPLSLAEVWRELPGNTTLISYFVSPMGAHAWVVDERGIDHVRLELGDGRLERVTCWAAQLAKQKGSSGQRSGRVAGECGSDAASSDEVYAALFAPLRSRIHHSNLIILPHGDLHYVPFAALRDPQHKHYLVEDYAITYLPSASALPLLRARESPMRGTALVLGDPDAPGQTALPGANEEARRVAAMLHTTARTESEASKELLYHLDGKVDIVHIAAHGLYDPVSPLFSTIFLAGSGTRSGRLTADEIQSELDLWGVNLVVLAVCQSGVGRPSGGDDAVSLTQALLYAGSPAIVSALWNIDDKGTTPMIEKFYARFIAGSAAATALREAQLAMLRDSKYSDPHFWAPFLLTGDPKGRWPPRPAGTVSLTAWHESR